MGEQGEFIRPWPWWAQPSSRLTRVGGAGCCWGALSATNHTGFGELSKAQCCRMQRSQGGCGKALLDCGDLEPNPSPKRAGSLSWVSGRMGLVKRSF